MLKLLNEEVWINTDQIQKVVQDKKDVVIILANPDAYIVLDNAKIEEVARYLNS